MKSSVNLYYNSNILPDRNLEIDNLSDYLSTLTKETLNDFQYVKHKLFLSIKINKDQSHLDYKESDNIDYISIQNGNESIIYYFVINKEWISTSTIKFDLYMDTINTAKNDYTLSNKTKIAREHKNRWIKNETESQTQVISMEVGEYDSDHDYTPATFSVVMTNMTYASSYTYELIPEADIVKDEIYVDNSGAHPVIWGTIYILGDAEGTSQDISITAVRNTYSRVINEYSEGLTPQLYKQHTYNIDGDGKRWNILYRKQSNDDDSHIDTILIPSSSIKLGYSAQTSVLTSLYAVASTTKYVYFSAKLNNNVSFNLIINDGSNNFVLPCNKYKSGGLECYNDYVIHFTSATAFTIYPYTCYYTNGSYINADYYGLLTKNGVSSFSNLDIDISSVPYVLCNALPSDEDFPIDSPIDHLTLTEINVVIAGIDSLDRYDPRIIKIIELPFCPIPYKIESACYYFDEGISLTPDSFMLLSENSFENEITTDVTNPLGILREVTLNPSVNDSRDDNNETKLLHSDFYLPKFVYDSFNYSFILEWQQNVENDTYLRFKFKTTNTINSRFLFDFFREHLKLDINDYSSILCVDRNNESLIMNDEYITYLKTGYNYDKKYKQINQISSAVGGVGAGIGGILSIAGGVSTSNPALIIGGIASIGTGLIATVNSVAKSELSLQQKLFEKRMQSTSVTGADDLDLLNYYTNGNKPKLVYYKVSERMRKALANLFYYTGYATEEYGVPQKNTRLWFNYIQAEVVFASSKNLSEEILNDIKTRYQIGITILHKVNNSWNFNQDKENWEVSIL